MDNYSADDEKKKTTPIALIVSSVAAVLVTVWLSFYKPVGYDNSSLDVDSVMPTEAGDVIEPDTELDIELVVAEHREGGYYVQVQTNDAFDGVCVFSLTSIDDEQTVKHESKLEPADRVSNCESSFSSRELGSGDYELTVSVATKDNKTKTISKEVTI